MHNHKKSATSTSHLNEKSYLEVDTEAFPVAKDTRVSDEIFYFGSTESDCVKKSNGSENGSLDSNCFSSVVSVASDQVANADVLMNKELDRFHPPISLKTLSNATHKIPHIRSESDSSYIPGGFSSLSCLFSSNLPKRRIGSEASAPTFEAAKLHQDLFSLRLNLNNLYAERHKLIKELESVFINRENLVANQRVLMKNGPSLVPNTQHLAELREQLAKESEKSARLLEIAVKVKQDILDPESLDDINELIKEYQKERHKVVDHRVKALEEQISILEGEKASSQPEELKIKPKSLLNLKNRQCEFLKAEISRNQDLLDRKLTEEHADGQPQTMDEANRQLRLKVLRFGLDEKRKKIQNAKNEADCLALKFTSLKVEAHHAKVSAIKRMLLELEKRQKSFLNSRNKVHHMRKELSEIKTASLDELEETLKERNQQIATLVAKIDAVKSDILELDSKPILLKQHLEESIKLKEAGIEKMTQDSALIKAEIRQRWKEMKNLQPRNAEASKKIQKLDDLNHRLSEVSKRLEFAENLNQRAQDVLSRQELRVANVKMKFSRVKELYAEERRAHEACVSKLKMEKEEYAQKLVSLNKKLDRLGRQRLLKGAQGIYKWILASLDIQESDCEDEIDECVGKRCVLICHEIKRLQEHSTWLEENLKAVESKPLNRQKISAIKAVLDHSEPQASDVKRRNHDRRDRPRPISMIETGSNKIFRTLTIVPRVFPTQIDARRRTVATGPPAPSYGGPTVSATQRRLAYSKSLRERRVTNRTQMSSFQREIPSTSASLSFRSPTPLIYTAFRNSKHTIPSRALDSAA